jgi:flagellar hook-length control protein FliK
MISADSSIQFASQILHHTNEPAVYSSERTDGGDFKAYLERNRTAETDQKNAAAKADRRAEEASRRSADAEETTRRDRERQARAAEKDAVNASQDRQRQAETEQSELKKQDEAAIHDSEGHGDNRAAEEQEAAQKTMAGDDASMNTKTAEENAAGGKRSPKESTPSDKNGETGIDGKIRGEKMLRRGTAEQNQDLSDMTNKQAARSAKAVNDGAVDTDAVEARGNDPRSDMLKQAGQRRMASAAEEGSQTDAETATQKIAADENIVTPEAARDAFLQRADDESRPLTKMERARRTRRDGGRDTALDAELDLDRPRGEIDRPVMSPREKPELDTAFKDLLSRQQSDFEIEVDPGKAGKTASAPLSTSGREGSAQSFQRGIEQQLQNRQIDQPEFYRNLVSKARVHLGEDKQQVVMQLKPERLGKVKLGLVYEGGKVTGQIITETPEARDLLEQGFADLKREFAEAGILIDEFNISDHNDEQAAERFADMMHGRESIPETGGTAEKAAPEISYGPLFTDTQIDLVA